MRVAGTAPGPFNDPVRAPIEIRAGSDVPACSPQAPPPPAAGHQLVGWGNNTGSQLGLDQPVVDDPTAVPSLHRIRKLVAGQVHTLVIDDTGAVLAFGDNSNGQISGSTSSSKLPVAVALQGNTAMDVAAGGNHSLALTTGGDVYSWGLNNKGQLGRATAGSVERTPARVGFPAGVKITQIAAGGTHSVALDSAGTVWIWGSNSSGQLGLGTHTDSTAPTQVPGLPRIAQVSTGLQFTVAVDGDGRVWSWGDNSDSQLARGADPTVPGLVVGVPAVKQLDAGWAHVVAISTDGAVWTWGANRSGQTGVGSVSDSSSPQQISVATSGSAQVLRVAASEANSAALDAAGRLWVWGDNTYDQVDSQVPDTPRVAAPQHLSAPFTFYDVDLGGGDVITSATSQ